MNIRRRIRNKVFGTLSAFGVVVLVGCQGSVMTGEQTEQANDIGEASAFTLNQKLEL